MQVQVDDLWASQSTLHLRVTVHDDAWRWRQRYYEAIRFADVPQEVWEQVIAYYLADQPDEVHEDIPLF